MSASWIRSLSRLIGAVAICSGLAIGAYFGVPYYQFQWGSPGHRLEKVWKQDLQELRRRGLLPSAWDDVKEIQLVPATDEARAWVKDIHTPIAVRSNGHHKLEILIVSWEEGRSRGAIVMHHLLELPSENMIWEVSRTYEISP